MRYAMNSKGAHREREGALVPRCRIVVAEHDDLTAKVIVAALRRGRRRFVVRAEDGDSVLDLFEKHRPHIVVLDLHLPVRNGLEVLRLLHRQPTRDSFRILVLSLQRQREAEARARRFGADDYVIKPFDPLDLASRVQRLIDGGGA